MRRLAMVALAVVCALGAADGAVHGAMAQRRAAPRDDNDDKLPPSVPPPIPTLPPARGIAGPRLQPGAVLCRTETDLQRRAVVNARRVEGEADPGNPLENCKLLNQEAGVEVVDKHGLGRTEVKLKPTGETGWTDAYVR